MWNSIQTFFCLHKAKFTIKISASANKLFLLLCTCIDIRFFTPNLTEFGVITFKMT